MDVPELVFVFWLKITLLKTPCGKAHSHNAEYTCSAKGLISF